MSGSRIIPGTEEVPNINGVYRAKVEVKGVKKVWDRVKVYNTISEAYKNKKQIRDNKYIGKTSSGIDVEMYLNKDGSIATAYPLYKKPKE
ncbi:hypothetical protein AU385_10810 [Bacillus halotolerans]|uniref:EndoU domain-containing protein n=1 Tax=Bacillus halotolerans TaxID=260554 RepID=UPI0007505ADB|nr:hypothetical protein AU385_10810 [Bacillus halotolerans]